MAEFTEIDWDALELWLATRPTRIQQMVRSHPPHLLYRLGDGTNKRVEIVSYAEDGTVTVNVLGKWNLLRMERQVFGIDIDILTECDLPDEDEPLGVASTPEEQLVMVNALRHRHDLEPLTAQELEFMKVPKDPSQETH